MKYLHALLVFALCSVGTPLFAKEKEHPQKPQATKVYDAKSKGNLSIGCDDGEWLREIVPRDDPSSTKKKTALKNKSQKNKQHRP